MASTSPRDNQQTLLPSGSPATLSPPSQPASDHGGEATHQWIPAGLGVANLRIRRPATIQPSE
eukprot:6231529-Amphidinium_carterae.1